MQISLICGYGIPVDIHQDQNYLTYLNVTFNQMYEIGANQELVVIASGGPTNCESPFKGTEAQAMVDYIKELMNREETKAQTAKWKLILEEKSLSTLENLLFTREILQQEHLTGPIHIFCEKTREQRQIIFAEQIFPSEEISIHAIDFDLSKNRYLDPVLIQQKEEHALKEGLWALEEPERLQKHHQFFEMKLEFLRARQAEGIPHIDAIHQWYLQQEDVLRKLMPDHPLLNLDITNE